MKGYRLHALAILMTLAATIDSLSAAELKRIGSLEVPGEPLESFDISIVDQATDRYFLADRTNKSLDIFDIAGGKFVGRVGGFVGQQESNDHSGPDGVYVVGNSAWVGDGDSTVKVVDIAQQKIVDTVSTGGQARADEMAYDPDHEILIAINDADSPPFATLISTKAGHRVLARVLFPDATDGAEQPVYFTGNKLFYVSIPEIGGVKAKGGVAVIDPLSGELVKVIPVEGCHPSGLAVGPADHLLLGCTAGARASGLPPESVVISANTGMVLEVIRGLGGTDMVAYSHKANQYYTASSGMPNGPVLGVIDAGSSTAVQVIPLPGDSPHSVAVSEDTGHVFVPLGVQGGGCGGCVAVFAPQ